MARNNFYVISLKAMFLSDVGDSALGTVVSSHAESYKASERARKLNRDRECSTRTPGFGFIEHDTPLVKGQAYPELARRYLAMKFDADAIYAMKGVLDPYWQSSKPVTEEDTAWMLEHLQLTLGELRERYEDKARAELDAAQIGRLANAERRARVEAVTNELATERSEFTYAFPAVAGMQAGRSYYAAQVPYSVLVKLFVFDEGDAVPARLRAQRQLNERRAADIGEYLVDNPDSYVLPAITASVSAEMSFEPLPVAGAGGRIGLLHVPMGATLLINDGQHRRKGIELAIARRPALRDESIVVTMFFDQGLERSQQMFADINGRQVKPSSAINALYDRRDPFNAWALSVIDMLPGIDRRIDVENSAVAAKSSKLWSLVAFKKFLSLLTGVTPKNVVDLEPKQLAQIDAFLKTFFDACAQHVPQWAAMIDGDLPAFEVREEFVIGHAVWLEALGMFARRALFTGYIMDHGRPEEGVIQPEIARWDQMAALAKVDPRRASLMWDNRCVVLGKMQKTSDGVKATAARLLLLAHVSLPPEMAELEMRLDGEFQAKLKSRSAVVV
ncbi:DNA sulfur modification protein DndB (plasmid) [Burkholderia aenigmatica]|uniref:DNA sulfur modification protein DndB n=1 Tax=Burkholderia aenigmatica TaxID=2015348 RepID=UPI003B439542